MAKTSVTERNIARQKLSESQAPHRDALRLEIKKNPDNADAIRALNKKKRDGSKIRVRRRCQSCGRPRGVYRKYGLCRMCIRKYMVQGLIPGLKKSSW